MIKLVKMIFLALAMISAIGCSKDKSNQGGYYPPGSGPWNPNPQGVGSRYSGRLDVVDSSQYRRYLEENNYCYGYSCRNIGDLPQLLISFNATTVDTNTGVSATVNLSPGPHYGYISSVPTRFYKVAGDTALNATFYGAAGTYAYNARTSITIMNNSVTASNSYVEISYRGRLIARGTIVRY